MKTNPRSIARAVLPAIVTLCLLALAGLPAVHARPGDLDPTFGTGGKVVTNVSGFTYSTDIATAVALQSDGKILVTGFSTASTVGSGQFALVRYHKDGSLDTTFNGTGKTTANAFGRAQSVAVQADGRILVAGYDNYQGQYEFALLRYHADFSTGIPGTFDTSFNGGKIRLDAIGSQAQANSMALQADGKILLAGFSDNDIALVRYHGDASTGTPGTPDTGFGTGGFVTTAAGSHAVANSIALQADGKILVAGANDTSFVLVRYHADAATGTPGTPDTSFGTGGIVTMPLGTGRSVAVQSDGKILVAGEAAGVMTLLRYDASGNLDPGFGSGGIVTTLIGSPSAAYGVAVQKDGRILVAGRATRATVDFALVRYHADGSLDQSFGKRGFMTTPIGSASDSAAGMAVQPDGEIVLAGTAYMGVEPAFPVGYPITPSIFALTRYQTAVIPDFNGDGNADLLFQNTAGQVFAWYMNGGGLISSSGFIYPDGLGDWKVVGRADMNNDGNADILFQNDAGQIYVWYLNRSGVVSSGAYLFTGSLGDWKIKGLADINTDGNQDIVFQNNLGQIYVWYLDGTGVVSSSAYLFTDGLDDWRIAGTADMNNDGNADLIFQNTFGKICVWYLDGSGVVSSGAYLFSGGLGDWRVAAIADMNNDGNADLIFQNDIGQIYVWYLNGSGVVSSGAFLFTGGLGDWRIR